MNPPTRSTRFPRIFLSIVLGLMIALGILAYKTFYRPTTSTFQLFAYADCGKKYPDSSFIIQLPPDWKPTEEKTAERYTAYHFASANDSLWIVCGDSLGGECPKEFARPLTIGKDQIGACPDDRNKNVLYSAITDPRNKNMVHFEVDIEDTKLRDQILSTFKFLDQITPTCTPRPACLDSEPRCLLPETPDMCPPSLPKQ